MTENKQEILVAYQVLSEKRNTYDTLLWQVPSICFVVISFLLSIEIEQVSFFLRILTCIVIVLFSLSFLQLMIKHRYYEVGYSKIVKNIEVLLGLDIVIEKKKNFIENIQTHVIWYIIIIMFIPFSIALAFWR